MHAFFKPVLIIIVLLMIFAYVFTQSGVIETKTEVVTTSTGMPQQQTTYIYHWDRLGKYIKNTPARVKKYFSDS